MEGAEDLAAVSAGEVGAADGAGEERVAREEQVFRREVEADAALRVSWGVEDMGGVAGDAGGGAVFGARVGRNDFGSGDAEPGGLLIHDGELREIVLVEENGSAGCLPQARRSTDVIDVCVGDDDLLQGEFVLGEEGENLRDVVAGVDDHGFAGGLVAKDGAVALEGADGESFADHKRITKIDAGLLALRGAVRGAGAGKHGVRMRRLFLQQDGKGDGGDDENAGQPGGGFGEHIGGGARAEGGLRTLAAECGSEVGAFALLQEDDHDEQQANDYVDSGYENNHDFLEPRGAPE